MERFEEPMLDTLKHVLDKRERTFLSPVAAFSGNGVRRSPEQRLETDYRQLFAVDVDRVLHSRAYTRYIDKTQVFYLIQNDHITHRVLHVQLVSKIARTIGRFLGLNEDLIEAIALGHDIGHTPFGHDGERILSKLCMSHGIGHFLHNLQSVQFLDRVERKGKGWNLCLQTLDGILCHDGEVHNQRLRPERNKTFETLDHALEIKKTAPDMALIPMTLEGCVVRMADTIAYVGRDLEDAIRLDMINRKDVPESITAVLGSTNGTIVYNLVTDVIRSSFQEPFIAFSAVVSDALQELKEFNLDRIYMNPKIKVHLGRIETLFELLFEQYLEDLHVGNTDSMIYRQFLKDISDEYAQAHRPEEIVRDFIAGMTDQYFLRQCPEDMRPQPKEF